MGKQNSVSVQFPTFKSPVQFVKTHEPAKKGVAEEASETRIAPIPNNVKLGVSDKNEEASDPSVVPIRTEPVAEVKATPREEGSLEITATAPLPANSPETVDAHVIVEEASETKTAAAPRKTEKRHPFTVQLSPTVWRRAKLLASLQGTSVSSFVEKDLSKRIAAELRGMLDSLDKVD
jgi:hypothetical protein